MEEIFGKICYLKWKRLESEYPRPRGKTVKPVVKYLMGCGGLLFIFTVILFPLVIFPLGSTVRQPNIPHEVTATMDIGNYQPIYEVSAQNNAFSTIDK